MTKRREDVQNVILDLLKERYVDSKYCFFYGSSATDEAKKNSDVDIIVVYAKTINSYREKFFYDEVLIDAFIYDEESLNGTLHNARLNGKFVTVEAVRSAITLPAPTAESEMLKTVAERIRKAGYIFQQRTFIQQYITNILDDLEDCTVALERNMLCIDLFKILTEIILIGAGVGIHDRKHAARELTLFDANLHNRMDTALLKGLSTDSSELVSVASEILNKIGGPLRDGFHMAYPNSTRMPLPVV